MIRRLEKARRKVVGMAQTVVGKMLIRVNLLGVQRLFLTTKRERFYLASQ